MVSKTVGTCTACHLGILYSYLFRSDSDQHMVAVMEVRHGWDMQGILVSQAQAFSSRGQHSLEMIAGANEGGCEDCTRVVVNLLGMTKLLNLAFGHDCNPIRYGQCLLLVMGDVDSRHLELLLNAAYLVAQRDTDFGIECRERLIKQQHLGFDSQCTSQGNALLLASRELVRIAAAFVAQPDEFE